MQLTVNAMYKTATGYLIPLSHFKNEKGVKYAVVRVLYDQTNDNGVVGFRTKTITMTTKEFREALDLGEKERVEIK